MTDRKKRLRIGRWSISLMFSGPYRAGSRRHGRGHFDFALPWVVVAAIRKSRP